MAAFFKCKDCADRELGCHGRCKKYKQAQEEWQKAKDYVKAEDDYSKYKAITIARYRERKRRGHRKD